MIDERHFDVELGEFRLPIASEVLIAIAASNLEIALHARHHEELLEQLWRLRKGIPIARLQARGHEEVARTLRRRRRQSWCLDLNELTVEEHVANYVIESRTHAHIATHRRATKVKVAVAQAHLLTHADPVINGEGKGGSGAQYLNLAGLDLESTRGEVGILIALRTLTHPTGDLEAVLIPQAVSHVRVIDDDLHNATCVPQIEEGNPTVIPSAGNPAGKDDVGSFLVGGEGPCCMRADH